MSSVYCLIFLSSLMPQPITASLVPAIPPNPAMVTREVSTSTPSEHYDSGDISGHTGIGTPLLPEAPSPSAHQASPAVTH